MTTLTPIKVEGFGTAEMLLAWNTGESYAVPYGELRFYCPCAFCVDENTGHRRIKRGDVVPGVKPLQAQQVGQYALKFWWTDRHNSGIYSFDTLHEICEAKGRLLAAGEQPSAAPPADTAGATMAAPSPASSPVAAKSHQCGCGKGGCGN